MYTGPSIDHSLMSPSGRMSKSARKAAMARETSKLFPPGFWDPPILTAKEQAQKKATQLYQSAQTLRDLASRGMNPVKYRRAAEKLEKQAEIVLGRAI